MRLTHLLGSPRHRERCPDGKLHYWLPTGTIEAKMGDNIRVDFYCRNCDKRHTEFLTRKQYQINENLISKHTVRRET